MLSYVVVTCNHVGMLEGRPWRRWHWTTGGVAEVPWDNTNYPNECMADAPVLSALPIPKCDCGRDAEVKQSRHEEIAARAFYTCSDRRVSFVS